MLFYCYLYFLGEPGLSGEQGRQGLQGFPGVKGKLITRIVLSHNYERPNIDVFVIDK